jgi:hypothetical protein
MANVDAQERVRLGIELQFIVSVHVYYELVYVKLALAEDECIVDKQDNGGDFLLCDLVEQAVVHVAHGVPFLYECVSVVSVEVFTIVRQPIWIFVYAI